MVAQTLVSTSCVSPTPQDTILEPPQDLREAEAGSEPTWAGAAARPGSPGSQEPRRELDTDPGREGEQVPGLHTPVRSSMASGHLQVGEERVPSVGLVPNLIGVLGRQFLSHLTAPQT